MEEFKWFDMKMNVDWLSFNDESILYDRECCSEEVKMIDDMVRLFNDEFGGIPLSKKKYIGIFVGRPLSETGESVAFVFCTDKHARIVKENECDIRHYNV